MLCVPGSMLCCTTGQGSQKEVFDPSTRTTATTSTLALRAGAPGQAGLTIPSTRRQRISPHICRPAVKHRYAFNPMLKHMLRNLKVKCCRLSWFMVSAVQCSEGYWAVTACMSSFCVSEILLRICLAAKTESSPSKVLLLFDTLYSYSLSCSFFASFMSQSWAICCSVLVAKAPWLTPSLLTFPYSAPATL